MVMLEAVLVFRKYMWKYLGDTVTSSQKLKNHMCIYQKDMYAYMERKNCNVKQIWGKLTFGELE